MKEAASERRGLIAGGNWIVDHLKTIDAWPPQDALANILAQASGNGGCAYNLLVNLAKLGAPFPLEAVGLVGADADGRFILEDCARHGIDTRQLRTTSEAPTSYTDVMTVRADGRRTFFHQRGANALLSADDFDFSRTTARWLMVGYALLLDRLDAPGADGYPALREVLRRGREAGLKTALDCVSEASDRFGRVVLPVLAEVDVFFANDYEAEKLTGLEVGRAETLNPAAMLAAADRLLKLGVRQWAIVHCPEGVAACGHAGERHWQPSVRVAPGEIRGSAGAGDALAAGVLFGLHEHWPMERCLEAGVAAAAASLRDVSCSAGIGRLDACLADARRAGFRLSDTTSDGVVLPK